jgi:hypothetical protein
MGRLSSFSKKRPDLELDGDDEEGGSSGSSGGKDGAAAEEKLQLTSHYRRLSDHPREGDKVEARLKGYEEHFSGKISADNGDGTFDVIFDDGDRDKSVPKDHIKVEGGSSLKEKIVLVPIDVEDDACMPDDIDWDQIELSFTVHIEPLEQACIRLRQISRLEYSGGTSWKGASKAKLDKTAIAKELIKEAEEQVQALFREKREEEKPRIMDDQGEAKNYGMLDLLVVGGAVGLVVVGSSVQAASDIWQFGNEFANAWLGNVETAAKEAAETAAVASEDSEYQLTAQHREDLAQAKRERNAASAAAVAAVVAAVRVAYMQCLVRAAAAAAASLIAAIAACTAAKAFEGAPSCVHLQVVCAAGLADRDSGKKGDVSDPYVKLTCEGADAPYAVSGKPKEGAIAQEQKPKEKTAVIMNNLDPEFSDEFFSIANVTSSSKLKLAVWDKDTFGKDDFIGQAEFNGNELKDLGYDAKELKLELPRVGDKQGDLQLRRVERVRVQILGAGYVPKSSMLRMGKREVWCNAYWKTPEMAKRTKVWRTAGVEKKIHIGRVKSNTEDGKQMDWKNETFELYLPSLEELEADGGRGYELVIEIRDGGSTPLAVKKLWGKDIKRELFMEGSGGGGTQKTPIQRYRRRSLAAVETAAAQARKASKAYEAKLEALEKKVDSKPAHGNMTVLESSVAKKQAKEQQSQLSKEVESLKHVAEKKEAQAAEEKKRIEEKDAAKPTEMACDQDKSGQSPCTIALQIKPELPTTCSFQIVSAEGLTKNDSTAAKAPLCRVVQNDKPLSSVINGADAVLSTAAKKGLSPDQGACEWGDIFTVSTTPETKLDIPTPTPGAKRTVGPGGSSAVRAPLPVFEVQNGSTGKVGDSKLVFEIWDKAANPKNLNDFVGEVGVTFDELWEIDTVKAQSFKLKNPEKLGELTVKRVELVKMQILGAAHLPQRDWSASKKACKSDVYCTVAWCTPAFPKGRKICKTEVVMDKVNVGQTDVSKNDHEWANAFFRLYLPDEKELSQHEEYKLRFKIKDKDMVGRSDTVATVTIPGSEIRTKIKHSSEKIEKKVLFSDVDEEGEVECRFFLQRVSEFTDPDHKKVEEKKAKVEPKKKAKVTFDFEVDELVQAKWKDQYLKAKIIGQNANGSYHVQFEETWEPWKKAPAHLIKKRNTPAWKIKDLHKKAAMMAVTAAAAAAKAYEDAPSQIHLQIVSGAEIANRDCGKKGDVSDPYVKLTRESEAHPWRTNPPYALSGITQENKPKNQTAVMWNKLDPTFTDEYFSLENVTSGSQLRVEVWDRDTMSKDDFIGQIAFNGKALKQLGYHNDDNPLLTDVPPTNEFQLTLAQVGEVTLRQVERLRVQILGAGYVPKSSRILQMGNSKREVWCNAYWKTPEMTKRTKVWRTVGVEKKIHIGRVKSNTEDVKQMDWGDETFELYLPSLEELEVDGGRGYELAIEISDGGSTPLAVKKLWGKDIKRVLHLEGQDDATAAMSGAVENAAKEAMAAEKAYTKKETEMTQAKAEAKGGRKEAAEKKNSAKELQALKVVAEAKTAAVEDEKSKQSTQKKLNAEKPAETQSDKDSHGQSPCTIALQIKLALPDTCSFQVLSSDYLMKNTLKAPTAPLCRVWQEDGPKKSVFTTDGSDSTMVTKPVKGWKASDAGGGPCKWGDMFTVSTAPVARLVIPSPAPSKRSMASGSAPARNPLPVFEVREESELMFQVWDRAVNKVSADHSQGIVFYYYYTTVSEGCS